MFEKKTLFIIGAGCSVPFGFPLGYKLREDIHSILVNDLPSSPYSSAIGEAFHVYTGEHDWTDRFDMAALIIRGGIFSRPSIDQFLDYHADKPDVVMLGKLLIASVIMGYEQKSNLCEKPEVKGDWLERVFHAASEDTSPNNVEEMFENLSFVTFNYDRCVEHYLWNQTLGLLGRNVLKARSVCSKIKVFHAHGSVGPVPWSTGYSGSATFGSGPGGWKKLLNSAERLRIFTERVEADDARSELQSARVVVICGFGFIKQNIELLTLSQKSDTPIFVNMFGIPEDDRSIVKGRLFRMFGGPSAGLTNLIPYDAISDEFMRLAGGRIKRGL